LAIEVLFLSVSLGASSCSCSLEPFFFIHDFLQHAKYLHPVLHIILEQRPQILHGNLQKNNLHGAMTMLKAPILFKNPIPNITAKHGMNMLNK
jgi:hypothetical protein